MIRARLIARFAGLALLSGVTAACSRPTTAAAPAAVAAAYMAAHPLPPTLGWTPAVALTLDDEGFAGAAATQAHCPAGLTAKIVGQVGNLPGCGAWAAAVETPSGEIVHLACGSIPRRRACPEELTARGDDYAFPMPGDYLWIRDNGQVNSTSDLQLITMFAVNIPDPDPTAGPWITTPASEES